MLRGATWMLHGCYWKYRCFHGVLRVCERGVTAVYRGITVSLTGMLQRGISASLQGKISYHLIKGFFARLIEYTRHIS